MPKMMVYRAVTGSTSHYHLGLRLSYCNIKLIQGLARKWTELFVRVCFRSRRFQK
jgi:hypothetical protein